MRGGWMDGWMDGWTAEEIMPNLRVTDPLIGLVLPPQIHLFPIGPGSDPSRSRSGDERSRLRRACTCGRFGGWRERGVCKANDRSRIEAEVEEAIWDGQTMEMKIVLEGRRRTSAPVADAFGCGMKSRKEPGRRRRSRPQSSCGGARDTGESTGE